jgi:peptidoglycan/LPS O-acetylase OafA/YrhL
MGSGWRRYENATMSLENQPGGGKRILPMEGMRGVAVALVFMVHYHAVFGALWPPGATAGPLAAVGTYGVDLFFMLSGFLIYGALLRRPLPYRPFIRRRLERLYPTFLAVFALYLALSFLVPGESKLPAQPVNMALYVGQNLLMLPGLLPIQPMITVAWSLSFEMFFYLLVPLLVYALRMRAWHPGLRLGLIGILAVSLVLWTHFFDLSLHVLMLLFLSGMALFEWRELATRGAPGRALHAFAAGLLALVLPIGFLLETSETLERWAFYMRTIWLAVAMPVVAFSAFSGTGPIAAMLSWRPLRWLGNMSYSYYLLHGLVLKALGFVMAVLAPGLGATAFWIAVPLAFAATAIGSFVLYALVEYPWSMAPPRVPKALPAK